MNRMVLANGQFQGGQIVRGSGVEITYDAAGQRSTQTRQASLEAPIQVWRWYRAYDPAYGAPENEPGDERMGYYETQMVSYTGERREEYGYRDDGQLMAVSFAEHGYTIGANGQPVSDGVFGESMLRAQHVRDALGRDEQYLEYDAAGTVTRHRHSIGYDGRGLVTGETVVQKKREYDAYATYVTRTENGYGTSGMLAWTTAETARNDEDAAVADTRTSYTHAWRDNVVVASSTHDTDIDNGSDPLFGSSYGYDGRGRLAFVNISDGRPRTVSFASSAEGQVLARTERSASAVNPAEYHYFLGERQVGRLSNDGWHPDELDYAGALQRRNWMQGTGHFRGGTTGPLTDAAFGGAGYDYINPTAAASGNGTSYRVQGGETLQQVAAAIWGDASLWYKIAEANGLSGSQLLAAGTTLRIPAAVTNIHNNASTFQVHDPNRAMGDLDPTAAKPQAVQQARQRNQCGVFGALLLTIVAVAVTAVVAPWATGVIAGKAAAGAGAMIAGGAIGGAAGSIASQTVGIATGMQQGFNWKGVALSALAGGVGGGLSQAIGGTGFLANAARGALGSAIAQGIGVATGLQDKFDWAGVAAAGIGAEFGGSG
jgi:hypothetical protein